MSEPALHQAQYSAGHHETWRFLYERQRANLVDKAAPLYLDSLDAMDSLTCSTIPRVDAMAEQLKRTTGWGIQIVPGLIEVDVFFSLLANKKFCTSVGVRGADQVDYIEEPDMFHDTYGHIPPLMDAMFAKFMHRFGEIGQAMSEQPERILELQRLYWYFVEFGFVEYNGEPRIFGAGIMSSFGEANHAWSSRHNLLPFDLAEVMATPFITTEIQSKYFVIDSISSVISQLNDWFNACKI